jgi:ABC-type antimicrobial peptide transport system permease subunit
MEDVIAASTTRPRFLTLILGLFSLLSLSLAAVGIYGVIAYSVEQRTAEFGIRIAVGAQPEQLLGQVMKQGITLGLVGVAIGLSSALLLTRFLEGMLFGVSKSDPSSLATTAGVLTFVSALASLLPAVRAMQIEPLRALRYE